MQVYELIYSAQQRNQSSLCVSLDLTIADTPLPHLYADEPLFPVARDVIAATHDIVCAYAINPDYYLCEGAAGMVALERIIRFVPAELSIIWNAMTFVMADSAARVARCACEQHRASVITLSKGGDARAMQIAATRYNAVVLQHTDSTGGCMTDLSRTPDQAIIFAAPQDATVLPSFTVVSRPVIYASKRADFAEAARAAAVAWRAKLTSSNEK